MKSYRVIGAIAYSAILAGLGGYAGLHAAPAVRAGGLENIQIAADSNRVNQRPHYVPVKQTKIAIHDDLRGSLVSIVDVGADDLLMVNGAIPPLAKQATDASTLEDAAPLVRVEAFFTYAGIDIPLPLAQLGNVWVATIMRSGLPLGKLGLTVQMWYEGGNDPARGEPDDMVSWTVVR